MCAADDENGRRQEIAGWAVHHRPHIGSVATVSRVWRYPGRAPDPNPFTNPSGRDYGPLNLAARGTSSLRAATSQAIRIVESVCVRM